MTREEFLEELLSEIERLRAEMYALAESGAEYARTWRLARGWMSL